MATAGMGRTSWTFDSAGTPIHCIEAGQGEPVILLHGFTLDSARQWIAPGVFDGLARRHRVVALDARGHGHSGKPHDPAWYGAEMGLDVVRLLDHLGLRRAHLVGYSMGAHILARLLPDHPERFLTATLGGASGRRNWTAHDQRRVETEAAELESGMLRSQILRLWPAGEPPPTEAQIRAQSARRLKGEDPLALAAARRANPAQVVTEAHMAAVRVPTLGLVGTDDPYLREFQTLQAVMPHLTLVTIAGATHADAPSRPEFLAALLDFLAAHPMPAGGGGSG